MLEAIRKYVSSIVVKAFLGVLILSFAVWGIGDTVVSLTKPSEIAKVGRTSIAPEPFGNELQRELQRYRQSLGEQMTMEQARELGLVDAVLGAMINGALFSLEAGNLDVAISDAAVSGEIKKNKEFNSPLGSFDRETFKRVLRDNGFEESGFIERVRGNMQRGQYLESIIAGAIPPSPMAEAIYRHRNEKRTAKSIEFTDAAMTAIGEPTDADLEQFHKDHAARFTAPEYRALTFLTFTAEDIAKEIAIPEEDVKEAYESRQGEFSTPQRRHVLQMVMNGQEIASKARQRLTEGDDFATVAKELANLDKETIDLGMVEQAQMPPELAGPAFELSLNRFSQPIESPLGWHLLQVIKIEEARTPTFDEVRTQLALEIAKEKSLDRLFSMANQLEDALSGGASLEDAALRMNLKMTKIETIDQLGKTMNGQAAKDLPADDNFLKLAFSTPENLESPLTELGARGYFILRVDKIIPSALKPLAPVRDEAKEAWKAEKRSQESKKAAGEALKRLQDGEDFIALAGQLQLPVKESAPFTRAAPNAGGLPSQLAASLFTVKTGEFAIARSLEGHILARLESITPADPAAGKQGIDDIRQDLTDSMRNDLLAQLAFALRQRYPVTINRRALDKIF